MKNEQFRKISGLTTTGWSWKLLSNLTLNKGDNLITISYCEDGALLDKLCVTNYILPPSGMGREAINKCDTTVVSNKLIAIDGSVLGQNFPNPFMDATQIDFTLSEPSPVSLQIYDVAGNLVLTLLKEKLNAGNFRVNWDATNRQGLKVASGTYIYRLVSGDKIVARKMLFIKE